MSTAPSALDQSLLVWQRLQKWAQYAWAKHYQSSVASSMASVVGIQPVELQASDNLLSPDQSMTALTSTILYQTQSSTDTVEKSELKNRGDIIESQLTKSFDKATNCLRSVASENDTYIKSAGENNSNYLPCKENSLQYVFDSKLTNATNIFVSSKNREYDLTPVDKFADLTPADDLAPAEYLTPADQIVNQKEPMPAISVLVLENAVTEELGKMRSCGLLIPSNKLCNIQPFDHMPSVGTMAEEILLTASSPAVLPDNPSSCS